MTDLITKCPQNFIPVKPDLFMGTNVYAGYCVGTAENRDVLKSGRQVERELVKDEAEEAEDKFDYPKGEYDGLQLLSCNGQDRYSTPVSLRGDEIRHIVAVTLWDPASRIYLDSSVREMGHVCFNVPKPADIELAVKRLEASCQLPDGKCQPVIDTLNKAIPFDYFFWSTVAGIGTLIGFAHLENIKDFTTALISPRTYAQGYKMLTRGVTAFFGKTRAGHWLVYRANYLRAWSVWKSEQFAATRLGGALVRGGESVYGWSARLVSRVPGPVKIAVGLAAVAIAVFYAHDADASERPPAYQPDWISGPGPISRKSPGLDETPPASSYAPTTTGDEILDLEIPDKN